MHKRVDRSPGRRVRALTERLRLLVVDDDVAFGADGLSNLPRKGQRRQLVGFWSILAPSEREDGRGKPSPVEAAGIFARLANHADVGYGRTIIWR